MAALHYKLEPDANEVMFIYCEAIEPTQADRHRWELMRRAVEDAKGRRLKLTITCPIGRKALEQRAPRADADHQHAEEPRRPDTRRPVLPGHAPASARLTPPVNTMNATETPVTSAGTVVGYITTAARRRVRSPPTDG